MCRNRTIAPTRRSQTNPPPPLTQEAVDQLVRNGIEAAIKAERERVREEATRAGGPAGGLAAMSVARECTFVGFMKCGPTQFHGTEGAIKLCRWFEKMESTFRINECAKRNKVKFATATLHGRALTWWNSQVATLGLMVANGKSWTEVKQKMLDEFCPTEEVQRLEDELIHLKLRDMNIVAYTERFNELALLCPDVVPNEKKKVELYIKGLLEIIKGETTSSRPAMLNEVVRMAHTLMEQKIQAKNERIAEGNKRRWKNNNQGGNNNRNNNDNRNNYNNRGNYHDNNRHNQYNQRRQDGARAMTAAQNNVVDQGGPAPKSNRYGLCHFRNCPAKCTRCNKRGHKSRDCKARGMATEVNVLPIRARYECKDRNHDQSQCPKLANQRGGNATGHAYALRDAKQCQGPNVVTGTFLLNNRYARVLFDSVSDKSFVNSGFSHLIDIKPVRLNICYEVELADGKLVSTNTVLRGCTLNLLNQLFEVDLMHIELDTFDVNIGMDWLVKHDALIVCGKKEVHIPVKGKMLVVKGNCDVS
ncbi:putative reverse transcriptase domain-containing protein [Tanacetum coccineum]